MHVRTAKILRLPSATDSQSNSIPWENARSVDHASLTSFAVFIELGTEREPSRVKSKERRVKGGGTD